MKQSKRERRGNFEVFPLPQEAKPAAPVVVSAPPPIQASPPTVVASPLPREPIVQTPPFPPPIPWRTDQTTYMVRLDASPEVDLPTLRGRISAVKQGRHYIGSASLFQKGRDNTVICEVVFDPIALIDLVQPMHPNSQVPLEVRGFKVLGIVE